MALTLKDTIHGEDAKPRYFLKTGPQEDFQEVSVEDFCRAERAAGFRPKLSSLDPRYWVTPATGGFSGSGTKGEVRYA